MWLRLLAAMIGVTLLLWIVSSSRPYDDTDADGTRSGLGLYTDARTGCQYLSAGGSGIVPRVDTDGKTHMGCGGSR